MTWANTGCKTIYVVRSKVGQQSKPMCVGTHGKTYTQMFTAVSSGGKPPVDFRRPMWALREHSIARSPWRALGVCAMCCLLCNSTRPGPQMPQSGPGRTLGQVKKLPPATFSKDIFSRREAAASQHHYPPGMG